MVYQNKVAAAIKVAGKVLREEGNTVTLPFGAEYSVLVKNLHSVRIKVNVSIDGKDIADGESFVISPNSSLDLERFITNGNNYAGNRFKFIERTRQIENHRGIALDDGLIRIEYKVEKVYPQVLHNAFYPPVYQSFYMNTSGGLQKGVQRGGVRSQPRGAGLGRNFQGALSVNTQPSSNVCSTQSFAMNTCETGFLRSAEVSEGMASMEPESDNGITVHGSESNQQFTNVADFPTESDSQVIVLQLRGGTAPVTVDKHLCRICGRFVPGHFKYCPYCSTATRII